MKAASSHKQIKCHHEAPVRTSRVSIIIFFRSYILAENNKTRKARERKSKAPLLPVAKLCRRLESRARGKWSTAKRKTPINIPNGSVFLIHLNLPVFSRVRERRLLSRLLSQFPFLSLSLSRCLSIYFSTLLPSVYCLDFKTSSR